MKDDYRPKVGLFVEGSRPTDPLRDDFAAMWMALSARCGHSIDLHIVGISKGQIVRSADLPAKAGAAEIATKGSTQLVAGVEPLDVTIQREHERHGFDKVIIAFDRFPPNQFVGATAVNKKCPMRSEVAYLLEHLAQSTKLDDDFRDAARELAERYASKETLEPRESPGKVEVIFMDPLFEALFSSDEKTVRAALNVAKRKPKDWPKFRTYAKDIAKAILDPAIEAVTGKRAAYSSAKSRWGLAFIRAADAEAEMWRHPIALRLCRTTMP